MSNLSIYVRLGADVLTEQQMFYGFDAGWGFQILMTLGTFLIGFCLAGFFRSVVITPRELIWPGVLGSTALTTTLHGVGPGDTQERYIPCFCSCFFVLYYSVLPISRYGTWKISRYAFFLFCILLLLLLVLDSRPDLLGTELLHLPLLDSSKE